MADSLPLAELVERYRTAYVQLESAESHFHGRLRERGIDPNNVNVLERTRDGEILGPQLEQSGQSVIYKDDPDWMEMFPAEWSLTKAQGDLEAARPKHWMEYCDWRESYKFWPEEYNSKTFKNQFDVWMEKLKEPSPASTDVEAFWEDALVAFAHNQIDRPRLVDIEAWCEFIKLGQSIRQPPEDPGEAILWRLELKRAKENQEGKQPDKQNPTGGQQDGEAIGGNGQGQGQGKKPSRSGKPKASAETIRKEQDTAARWQDFRDRGGYKPDFAKDNGMTVKELDALLDRVRKRKKPLE